MHAIASSTHYDIEVMDGKFDRINEGFCEKRYEYVCRGFWMPGLDKKFNTAKFA
jgi:hypothetical protein